MKMTKSVMTKRLLAVVEGELDIDELTPKELQKLSEFVFKALEMQNAYRMMPSNDTKH